MILKHFYMLACVLLCNFIKLLKSAEIQQNLDNVLMESTTPAEVKDLQELNNAVKLDLNISLVEEKLKSLTATIGEMETTMNSFVNNSIEYLDQHMRSTMDQIFQEKIKSIDQILKDTLKLVENKTQYTVQEIKCNGHLPRDCNEINECNNHIYNIMIPELNTDPFPVVCDLKTLNGGWTIIQRRQDGSENFYRNWTEYVKGFGDLNGEFFIGLEKLHALTTKGEPQELHIILEDFEGTRKYANYGLFKVGSEQTDYKLTVGNYTGNAGDSLSDHNGYKFSTKDRDNDKNENSNCAEYFKGAWWYYSCYLSNLNGIYSRGSLPKSEKGKGMSWSSFRGSQYSLKFVQMMIRAKQD